MTGGELLDLGQDPRAHRAAVRRDVLDAAPGDPVVDAIALAAGTVSEPARSNPRPSASPVRPAQSTRIRCSAPTTAAVPLRAARQPIGSDPISRWRPPIADALYDSSFPCETSKQTNPMELATCAANAVTSSAMFHRTPK